MASLETWQHVREFFRPHSNVDNWGDPFSLQDGHLLKLYEFRKWLGRPIYVTAGVKTSGHKPNSYHYSKRNRLGYEIGHCATDIIIPDYEESSIDLLLDATRFGFTGIGYYPHWKFNGEEIGGLHLDSRPARNYRHARWIGVPNEEGEQKYVELSLQNLIKY